MIALLLVMTLALVLLDLPLLRNATRHVASISGLRPPRFAYAALISTSDEERRYVGYLSGVLVARKALQEAGSTADFWLLIVSSPTVDRFPPAVESVLERNNVLFKYIKSPWEFGNGVYGVMLCKIYCWTLTEYDEVQYMDLDIFPTANMDVYFDMPRTTAIAGKASPLNGGWILLHPSMEVHSTMAALVQQRPALVNDKRPED